MGTERICRARPRGVATMTRHPTPAPHREIEPSDEIPVRGEWNGLCPECGESAELTSYLGSDDMRSEEHWWCPHCMLGLHIRVVRLVERARSGKTGAPVDL